LLIWIHFLNTLKYFCRRQLFAAFPAGEKVQRADGAANFAQVPKSPTNAATPMHAARLPRTFRQSTSFLRVLCPKTILLHGEWRLLEGIVFLFFIGFSRTRVNLVIEIVKYK